MAYAELRSSTSGTYTNYQEVSPPSQQVTASNYYEEYFVNQFHEDNSRGSGPNRMASAVTSSFQPFESVSLEVSPPRRSEVDSCHQQYWLNKEQRRKVMNYIEDLLAGIAIVATFYLVQKSVTEIGSSIANDRARVTEVAEKCNAPDLADGVNETFDKHKEEVTVLILTVKDGVAIDTVNNLPLFKSIINEKEAALEHCLSELKKRVG